MSEYGSWNLNQVCFAFSTATATRRKHVPQTLFSNNPKESPSPHWSQKSHNWKVLGENGMLKLKKKK